MARITLEELGVSGHITATEYWKLVCKHGIDYRRYKAQPIAALLPHEVREIRCVLIEKYKKTRLARRFRIHLEGVNRILDGRSRRDVISTPLPIE